MVLWKFKSCLRCGGDIFTDRDLNGWYEQCLQCSFRRELLSSEELLFKKKQQKLIKVGERRQIIIEQQSGNGNNEVVENKKRGEVLPRLPALSSLYKDP